jgi:hypothetical protein
VVVRMLFDPQSTEKVMIMERRTPLRLEHGGNPTRRAGDRRSNHVASTLPLD